MRFRFRLGELMLAIAFAGVYAALVAGMWGGWLWASGLVGGAVVLAPAYLVALLMMRRHLSTNPEGGRSCDGSPSSTTPAAASARGPGGGPGGSRRSSS